MSRLTAQRQAILEVISSSDSHWEAESLARELADRGQSIGIATVYRGLAALEDLGLIASIQFGGKKRYERTDKGHHDHLVCTHCGSIEEFIHPQIERLQQAAAEQKGFLMTGHQLVIYGLCPACAARDPVAGG
jgi:Fur family transcriptional regulator, ferric uptake regulator